MNLPQAKSTDAPVPIEGDLLAYRGHDQTGGGAYCWKCKLPTEEM